MKNYLVGGSAENLKKKMLQNEKDRHSSWTEFRRYKKAENDCSKIRRERQRKYERNTLNKNILNKSKDSTNYLINLLYKLPVKDQNAKTDKFRR